MNLLDEEMLDDDQPLIGASNLNYAIEGGERSDSNKDLFLSKIDSEGSESDPTSSESEVNEGDSQHMSMEILDAEMEEGRGSNEDATKEVSQKGNRDLAPRMKLIGPGTKVTSRGLMKFMGVNGYTKCSLGIKKIRQQTLEKLEKKQRRKLIRLFQ